MPETESEPESKELVLRQLMFILSPLDDLRMFLFLCDTEAAPKYILCDIRLFRLLTGFFGSTAFKSWVADELLSFFNVLMLWPLLCFFTRGGLLLTTLGQVMRLMFKVGSEFLESVSLNSTYFLRIIE